MVTESTLTVSLEEFGLSNYEARAYVTLISKGTISASELAFYAELPRTKVYPILLKLEKKRLVTISKSKPIMCTATSPEDAFDDIVHEQINKVNAMNTLVSNLKKVSEESRKLSGAEEKKYFHLNISNVLNQLKVMIEGSKSSIFIMADHWGLGLLAECKEQLITVLRRDLDVKIILPSSQISSELFKSIPDGASLRISEILQNCFIFDETELLLIDSDNGKGATFSSTDVLGANLTKLLSQVWKTAIKADAFADMTKTEAQEIYKIIKIINENALAHIFSTKVVSKNDGIDLLKLLEKNGINLKARTLEEVLEIINSSIQVMCSGSVDYEPKTKNIIIDSKLNSGHSLPWVFILESYLQKKGLKTRLVYQNSSQKGEKVHIKIIE